MPSAQALHGNCPFGEHSASGQGGPPGMDSAHTVTFPPRIITLVALRTCRFGTRGVRGGWLFLRRPRLRHPRDRIGVALIRRTSPTS